MENQSNNVFKSRINKAKERLMLDLNEASMLTNESVPTLRRRIASGMLVARQNTYRGRWLISREDLNRYLGI